MGRRRQQPSEEERSIARDFVMARLAATRATLASATGALDECLRLFVDVDEDSSGKERADLLETIDGCLGEAATSVQLAQEAWPDVDAEEGEPETDPAPEPGT